MHVNTDRRQPGAAGSGTAIRVFPGLPESVREARAFAAGFLAAGPSADDVALMTSELVTNAIRYSASGLPGGQVTVSVRPGAAALEVHVIDDGEMPSCFVPRRGLGKGLQIVGRLASASGADGRDWWFTVCPGGAR